MALFLSFLIIDKTFYIEEFLVISSRNMIVVMVIKYISWKPIFVILNLWLASRETHLMMGNLSLHWLCHWTGSKLKSDSGIHQILSSIWYVS